VPIANAAVLVGLLVACALLWLTWLEGEGADALESAAEAVGGYLAGLRWQFAVPVIGFAAVHYLFAALATRAAAE